MYNRLIPWLVSITIIAVFSYAVWNISAVEPNENMKTPLKLGGEFTLTNTKDETVTQEHLLGNFSLVYFGFTFCPDICPTALHTMTQAIESLEPLSDKLTPVFITVDPERDTVSVMKDYVSNFHPRFIGLTGTPEQTHAAANAYRVFYRLQKNNGDENYLVDHTGFIYLMSPTGEYLTHFTDKDSSESIMVTLTKYLR